MITEQELNAIELRANRAQQGPWKAYIENRDHESGDNFIMTGEFDSSSRGEDIYLSGATDADHDFIAHARQDIPRLIQEIRLLMKKNS